MFMTSNNGCTCLPVLMSSVASYMSSHLMYTFMKQFWKRLLKEHLASCKMFLEWVS